MRHLITPRVWAHTAISLRESIPHTGLLPIIRMSLEERLLQQLRKDADAGGYDFEWLRQHAKWREEIDRETNTLVLVLTVPRLEVQEMAVVHTPVHWSGGPRDGQEISGASNGEIAWDGPLAVVVRDDLAVWRDVGEGARREWAAMSEVEREQVRVQTRLELTAT